MSPADLPIVPTAEDLPRRSPWMLPVAMVACGVGLILVSGFFLLWVFALATMISEDEPHYWSVVLGRMFAPQYGARVAIPSCFGLVLGFALFSIGFYKAGAKRG